MGGESPHRPGARTGGRERLPWSESARRLRSARRRGRTAPGTRRGRHDHLYRQLPRRGTAPVLIRAATPSDTAALGRLGGLLVRQHHAWDPARFIPAEPETEHWYGAFLASQLDRPDVVILVAEQDSRVIGFVYAGLEDTDWMALRGPAGALYD